MSTRSAKTRLFFLLVAVTALLALAAAGCGGGDESTGEPAPPAETEAPAGTTEEAPPAAETEETEPAPEPASLRVALEWFPNPDHIALYYALENGYWDDQGSHGRAEDAFRPVGRTEARRDRQVRPRRLLQRRHVLRCRAGHSGDRRLVDDPGAAELDDLARRLEGHGARNDQGSEDRCRRTPVRRCRSQDDPRFAGAVRGRRRGRQRRLQPRAGVALRQGGRRHRRLLQHRGDLDRDQGGSAAERHQHGGARGADLRRAPDRRQQRAARGRSGVCGRGQPLHRGT